MGTAYEIRIHCSSEQKIQINGILGPSSDTDDTDWAFTIEEPSPQFTTALYVFTEMISKNISALNNIGIINEAITFWYLYEYDQQCNMEFGPDLTRSIGELGISLCISCWEK